MSEEKNKEKYIQSWQQPGKAGAPFDLQGWQNVKRQLQNAYRAFSSIKSGRITERIRIELMDQVQRILNEVRSTINMFKESSTSVEMEKELWKKISESIKE